MVSKCGSPPEITSRWIDSKLNKILIPTRLKDSFELLDILSHVQLNPHTPVHIILADAENIYGNLNLDNTLWTICAYLDKFTSQDQINFNMDMFLELLEVVLFSKIFIFGDMCLHQIKGIAMDISCAGMVAILFVVYHECTLILIKYSQNIILYKRFIDEFIALWLDGIRGFITKDLKKNLH